MDGDVEWRTIPGYPDGYMVSNTGLIMTNGKERKAAVNGWGYLSLSIGGKTKMVHRLVALAFIGESGGLQVNHKDGNKLNNRVENLEYVTPGENESHAYRIGIKKPVCGEEHARAKLTEADVMCALEKVKQGFRGKDIAEELGVNPPTIYAIVGGRTWTHVTGIKRKERRIRDNHTGYRVGQSVKVLSMNEAEGTITPMRRLWRNYDYVVKLGGCEIGVFEKDLLPA